MVAILEGVKISQEKEERDNGKVERKHPALISATHYSIPDFSLRSGQVRKCQVSSHVSDCAIAGNV